MKVLLNIDGVGQKVQVTEKKKYNMCIEFSANNGLN